MNRRLLLLSLTFALLASDALARVISYAPYTNRAAVRSIHHREHRYFALIESDPLSWTDAQVVLYDVEGEMEPRVIYPNESESRQILFALVSSHVPHPASSPIPVVLIGVSENSQPAYYISNPFDFGSSWKRVTGIEGWPPSLGYAGNGILDFGGPYSHGITSSYLVDALGGFVINTPSGIYSIDFEGRAKQLVIGQKPILGRNADGTQILVRVGTQLARVDAAGTIVTIADAFDVGTMHGWLTSDGSAYILAPTTSGYALYLYRNNTRMLVAAPLDPGTGVYDPLGAFAVPTADYDGAWIIQRRLGKPTVLSRHTIAGGIQTMWSDVSGPEVEALHTTKADNDKLLIQVHRPRAATERWFIDPALAVWRAGEPAPRVYDELFLNEAVTKGFVHLDVNRIAGGTPFIFDSGIPQTNSCQVCSPGDGAGGGADVTQEWGVVRASLKQRLVLPGVARQPGAFGSYWLSDVVIRNPLAHKQRVDFRFVPLGDEVQATSVRTASLTLAAQEIRVLRDVLKELFSIDQGGGALYIEPEHAVTATSRTYTRSGEGSFGFNMGAIDVLNAAGPRFPLSFAGAFPGENFRTNMILTDTSGRGTAARIIAHGVSGRIGLDTVAFSAPTGGLQQLNFLQGTLGLAPHDAGGMTVQPTRGTAIATVVAMDNRTNDPTYFPPDLPAPDVRTIPVIGHVDGAFNSKFRSDVFILNTSSVTRTLRMEAKKWDTTDPGKMITFTLLPGEARVIRDALPTLFQMTGVARLRYGAADFMGDGVNVTSRTYNVNEGGGTYGTLIPPLNSFQSAGPGEKLEILGVIGGTGFRTNVGFIELGPAFDHQWADMRVYLYDDRGTLLDQFPLQLGTAGGMQINDIFGSRGIPQPAAALIVIEVIRGHVGAYATLTDNVTNDSSYLGANLAAQPN